MAREKLSAMSSHSIAHFGQLVFLTTSMQPTIRIVHTLDAYEISLLCTDI